MVGDAWARPLTHEPGESRRAAVMVNSTGDQFRACLDCSDLPAGQDSATARPCTLPPTLASDQLPVGTIVRMGRSCVPTRYLCGIRADCPYAPAHHVDDGRPTINPVR